MTRRTGMTLTAGLGLMLKLMVVLVLARAKEGPPKVPVPESVAFEPDITYATVDGVPLKLDLARPKAGEGPWPLVVCIHGGGWQAGVRAEFHELIFGLATQGYVAVSVEYRLAPQHRFPAQIDDVKAAVAFLRANAKERRIDPDRIAAVGASAGGHLALMLATDPAEKLRGAVSLAGPTDLTRNFTEPAEGIVRALIGPDAANPAEVRRQASPIHRIGPDTAPVLMVHGDHDELVPYDQATTFRDACVKAGREATLVTIPDGRHAGGGTPEDGAASVAQILRFLRDRTQPRP